MKKYSQKSLAIIWMLVIVAGTTSLLVLGGPAGVLGIALVTAWASHEIWGPEE